MTRTNLSVLFSSFFLFSAFPFSNHLVTNHSSAPRSNCMHMEVKEAGRPNISFAFDFKNGYAYGAASNLVSAAYINGGNIKLTTDGRGRPVDFETLHFEYDAEGTDRMTNNDPKKGDQTFNFASGSKIFQVESKDSRGSWSRAIYNYNASGDPADIKFLGEDYTIEGKKEKKEEIAISLAFYPDKPSIDKGNALVCWFFTNFIYAFYKDNFVFGQHLPKTITGTVQATDFKTSGEAGEVRTVPIENNYSYDFDNLGRPVAVKILSSIMGRQRPMRTFVISYGNCP